MSILKVRSAVITGGITGQGLAIARRLAAEGVNLALGSYLGEGGRLNDAAAYPGAGMAAEVKTQLEKLNVCVHAGHLDVRDSSSIEISRKRRRASAGRQIFSSMPPAPRPNIRCAAIRTICGRKSSTQISQAPSA
jgi:NAD(P)-dependent dehydrogenase (short-subunit alcohol dehydrogenase family)